MLLNPRPPEQCTDIKALLAGGAGAVAMAEAEAKEDEQEPIPECTCGGTPESNVAVLLKCRCCGIWQHDTCTDYDLETRPPADFTCTECCMTLVHSRATLVVSPKAIAAQWAQEVKKHTKPGTLRVLVYHGVRDEVRRSTHKIESPLTIDGSSPFPSRASSGPSRLQTTTWSSRPMTCWRVTSTMCTPVFAAPRAPPASENPRPALD